ncbi:MAG: DUF1987 domain-containing protein [Bacteroidales bacterium]|jgi:hypothetical protein|nr:DUF1987 domain-containing protein [Bacteroidales bacterium]
MESLEVLENHSCPNINMNAYDGKIEIRGNSMPENALSFYNPIIEWIDKYSEFPNPVTEITFQMNLLNTSSTKLFSDIFKIINKIVESGKSTVNIIWYYSYGDDDIQEVGVDFKEFTKANFELVAVND